MLGSKEQMSFDGIQCAAYVLAIEAGVLAGVENHNILSEFAQSVSRERKQLKTVLLSGVTFSAGGAAISLRACQRMNFPT